jgi:hypothetical protein
VCIDLRITNGHALAQAVSRWLPAAATRVRARSGHVGFVVDEVILGLIFSEYFHHSTKFSVLIITRSRCNRSIGGRRAEWTQLWTPHPINRIEKNYVSRRKLGKYVNTVEMKVANSRGKYCDIRHPTTRIQISVSVLVFHHREDP